MEHEADSGALSPAGRFARMEAALERIESKLDSKADHRLLMDLEVRIGVLERTDSNEEAVAAAVARGADGRYRMLLWAVGVASLVNFSLTMVALMASRGAVV